MQKKLGLMGAHIARSKMGKLQLFLARQVDELLHYELIDSEGITNFDPIQCVPRWQPTI